jgi:hypothetical protein
MEKARLEARNNSQKKSYRRPQNVHRFRWHDYLEVAPRLLPHLPAAWSAHFEKTRSGVNSIVPPPAEEVQSQLRAVA